MDLDTKVELLNKYRSEQEILFGVEFRKEEEQIVASFTVKKSMLQPLACFMEELPHQLVRGSLQLWRT